MWGASRSPSGSKGFPNICHNLAHRLTRNMVTTFLLLSQQGMSSTYARTMVAERAFLTRRSYGLSTAISSVATTFVSCPGGDAHRKARVRSRPWQHSIFASDPHHSFSPSPPTQWYHHQSCSIPRRDRLLVRCSSSSSSGRGEKLWRRESSLEINSAQNSRVKNLKSLLTRKRARDTEGKVVVEGHRLVMDAIATCGDPDFVLLSDSAFDSPYADQLLDLLEKLPHDRVCLCAPGIMQQVSDTVTPQGVVAVLSKPSWEDAFEKTKPDFVLVLDNISDPGNMGTLVRTGAGVDAQAIVMMGSATCDPWSPKSLRAAMGASFRIPILEVQDWSAARALLIDEWGLKIFAADGGEENHVYYNVDWSLPSALIVGSEATGLAKDIRDAQIKGEVEGVKIPLYKGVESLNAAVAGSIILAEAQRQRTSD